MARKTSADVAAAITTMTELRVVLARADATWDYDLYRSTMARMIDIIRGFSKSQQLTIRGESDRASRAAVNVASRYM